MTAKDAKRSLPSRIRRCAYTTLVTGVAVGAVCVGAGSSPADTLGGGQLQAETSSEDASSEAGSWTLTNSTSENIWGSIERQRGSTHSGIGWDKANPAKPNEKAGTWIYDTAADKFSHDVKNWGRICYRGKWWNMGDPKNYDFPYEDLILLPSGDNLILKNDSHGIAYETTVKLMPTPGDSGCGAP